MLKDDILARDEYCVLCGGQRRATTIEHIPSRSIFSGKHRPKGLEVGACVECNSSTRRHEIVVALLSRMFPDAPLESDHIGKLMRSAFRHNPGLYQEMRNIDQLPILHRLGPAAAALPSWNFVSLGPIAQGALREFGFKLGAVLHYHQTQNILPVGGGVHVSVFSNFQSYTQGIPKQLLQLLGPPQTLRAGNWDVGNQFRYASLVMPEGDQSYHLAVFRESFALLLMAAEKVSDLTQFPALQTRPV